MLDGRWQRFLRCSATVGLYDPPVRELMGYTWSPRQERLHRRFGRLVHWTTRCCRNGADASRGSAGAFGSSDRVEYPSDAPLVETPARNLPPVEHRGDGRSTTARLWLSPYGVPGPHRAVEIPHLRTVLRVREPARLHRRISAEDPALDRPPGSAGARIQHEHAVRRRGSLALACGDRRQTSQRDDRRYGDGSYHPLTSARSPRAAPRPASRGGVARAVGGRAGRTRFDHCDSGQPWRPWRSRRRYDSRHAMASVAAMLLLVVTVFALLMRAASEQSRPV